MTGPKIDTWRHEKYGYALKTKLTLADLELVPECRDFVLWYREAKPKDSFIYFRGASLSVTQASWKIKIVTWKYATNGWIYLVQNKRAIDDYEFIAQKTDEKRKRMIPHATDEEGKVIVKDAKWLSKVRP